MQPDRDSKIKALCFSFLVHPQFQVLSFSILDLDVHLAVTVDVLVQVGLCLVDNVLQGLQVKVLQGLDVEVLYGLVDEVLQDLVTASS